MTDKRQTAQQIRACGRTDDTDVLAIINAAAEAYRGIIPDDRWHEPYMSAEELASEIDDGVQFSGFEAQNQLIGVMGVQRKRNVDLIRHAYVMPEWQGHGIGSKLLYHICQEKSHPILIGTWAAADWAIRFYVRN